MAFDGVSVSVTKSPKGKESREGRRKVRKYRKYRSLGTTPRLTFQARLLHNQEDVNTDRYV